MLPKKTGNSEGRILNPSFNNKNISKSLYTYPSLEFQYYISNCFRQRISMKFFSEIPLTGISPVLIKKNQSRCNWDYLVSLPRFRQIPRKTYVMNLPLSNAEVVTMLNWKKVTPIKMFLLLSNTLSVGLYSMHPILPY